MLPWAATASSIAMRSLPTDKCPAPRSTSSASEPDPSAAVGFLAIYLNYIAQIARAIPLRSAWARRHRCGGVPRDDPVVNVQTYGCIDRRDVVVADCLWLVFGRRP